MRAGLAHALRILTAGLALAGGARADGLYLHVLPASTPTARSLDDPALRVLAFTAGPEALARRFATGVEVVASDHVDIALDPYPQLAPLAPDAWRAPSFVIDYEQPALVPLRARLASGSSPQQLRDLVDAAIPDKSMGRGWDLASRVATTGSGDCTEHAVLLTALARAAGVPARVALGVLLVQEGGRVHAFGHAWSELYEEQTGRWRPLDATPVPEHVDAVAYLPTALLGDEGPGYALALARGMQRAWVERVEIR